MAIGERQPARSNAPKENMKQVICFRGHSRWLYSRIPLISLVFPIATPSSSNIGEGFHQFDVLHILRLLVAELAFEAQTKRRAVRYVERPAVQVIGQDRLGVKAIGDDHTLVVRD